jgi:drug/metabolite transporter (DMT)-like permease
VIKVLSRRDSAAVIVIYVNLLILPLALVPAVLDWRTPAPGDVLPILGIGLFSTLAQYGVARSIAGADARIVQPINFLRLPFAAAVGYFAFRELPDLWTWVGAVIIFLSAWYVVGREAR